MRFLKKSSEEIQPDLEKINIIKNYPVPKNAKETKRFVAYKCKKSFEFLKKSLMSPPILQYPNFDDDNTFILQTDASGYAIGSVLCNNDNRPIAFASRSLNKATIRYPTIEKELLAIVWSVKYFRPYLFGRRFIIRTDHKPLIYLFNQTNPSSRLAKFRLLLEEYDNIIEYVKGTANVAADALSRIRLTSEELKEINQHGCCVSVDESSKKGNN